MAQIMIASSKCSFGWGSAQNTVHEKIKKSAARGSEKMPVGKNFTKRPLRPLFDHLQYRDL